MMKGKIVEEGRWVDRIENREDRQNRERDKEGKEFEKGIGIKLNRKTEKNRRAVERILHDYLKRITKI
jgi:hypothetical protein